MTAVVGVLNKHAVAIAADSAVTVGGANGRKIFNKANKVFALSKEHPVGIMIYNSATFMSTPWETIIKIYRKQLGSKSFPTLRAYQEDFIEFLRTKDFYTDVRMQELFLENFILEIVDSGLRETANKHPNLTGNLSPENRIQFLTFFEQEIDTFINRWSQQQDFCPEFEDYTLDDFIRYSNVVFGRVIQSRFIINGFQLSEILQQKIREAVHYVLRIQEEYSNFTGLIFTGFGEDEIYPQLIPVNISMVVHNRLRYFVNEGKGGVISNYNNSCICPFAQTDVIDTILAGIDPSLDNIYKNNFSNLLQKYNQQIIASIGDTNPLLSDQIQSIDIEAIVQEFSNLNQQIKRNNYITPLMNAVSSLSKEDLAEMAESLIYLTYLKRRITFAEESVGGPVDVAVISKGDGFVWIKRKHYFKPELNQHFFDNYFKT